MSVPASEPSAHPHLRGLLRASWFGLWLAAVTVPLAMLAAQHDLPLARQAAASGAAKPSGATVRHVLAADCACSAAVADRLVERGPRAGEREEVWIVGADATVGPQLRQRGYVVRTVTADEATRTLGMAGAPFLIVYDLAGRSELYAGGYTAARIRSAADVPLDDLITSIRAGVTRRAHPAYGCVVGERLRRQVDPLRLKYGPPHSVAAS